MTTYDITITGTIASNKAEHRERAYERLATDGTETITINAQQILKQAAKHTNDKHILKDLLKTLKHIQQDLQQHGPHQGLLHPNDRTPQTMITQQQEIQQLLEEMENNRPKVNQALKTLGLNIQLQPLTLLQDDRPHTTKHKELKEFIQKSAETSRLNRETYMKKSQEIQDRIDKHRRRAKEYLSQLP